MSTSYLVGLLVAVTVLFGARLAFAVFPLRRIAMPVTVTDAIVFAVGAVGLAVHCGAMFFSGLVEPLPGADPVINDIRALGTASIIWYVVPAVLVLLGLRRQHPVALAMIVLVLVAVGITMYDGGSLRVHLAAIFVSVLVLAGVVALLVRPPWQRNPAGTPTTRH